MHQNNKDNTEIEKRGELQMAKKTILVDDTRRELSEHGTETFPLTVHHDDLWMFEGKNVPIHWHQEI